VPIRLIDCRVANLVGGYEKVLDLESRLQTAWRHILRARRMLESGNDIERLSILPEWCESLKGELPAPSPTKHGEKGERQFIQRLQRRPEELTFMIYGLRPAPNEDVDLTLVGPKGVWVFEVKHWSGTITYRDGEWHRMQNGVEVPVTQHPDGQWQRMANIVAGRLSEMFDMAFATVKGGLVFTIDDSQLNISSACPAKYGNIGHWESELASAPAIRDLDHSKIFEALDILLRFHREVDRTCLPARPMDKDDDIKRLAYALQDKLIEQVHKRR